ncbi:MAG: DUF2027 domain-containing protein [Bacteroidales bacterium]
MANIEVGDKVRFLDEVGEGNVTRIQGNIVYVYTDDGFEIPVNSKQLVVVEKNNQSQKSRVLNNAETINYNYAEKKENTFEEDNFSPLYENTSDTITNDIYLAFVHEEGLKNEELNLYLINDSYDNLTFCLFNRKLNEYEFMDTALLEGGSKLLIKQLTKEEIVQIASYIIQGVLYNSNEKKLGKILNKELKVNALYLLNNSYFKENDFFDEPAFMYSILQGEKNQQLIKQQKIEQDLKESQQTTKKESVDKPELVEVDLHIEALVNDYKNLTPTEMLHIQINHFRKKLEEYIMTYSVKKVVFIHGVGNGTLKLEIRKILTNEYSHYDYQDASYQDYGFGATMVILRK